MFPFNKITNSKTVSIQEFKKYSRFKNCLEFQKMSLFPNLFTNSKIVRVFKKCSEIFKNCSQFYKFWNFKKYFLFEKMFEIKTRGKKWFATASWITTVYSRYSARFTAVHYSLRALLATMGRPSSVSGSLVDPECVDTRFWRG